MLQCALPLAAQQISLRLMSPIQLSTSKPPFCLLFVVQSLDSASIFVPHNACYPSLSCVHGSSRMAHGIGLLPMHHLRPLFPMFQPAAIESETSSRNRDLVPDKHLVNFGRLTILARTSSYKEVRLIGQSKISLSYLSHSGTMSCTSVHLSFDHTPCNWGMYQAKPHR